MDLNVSAIERLDAGVIAGVEQDPVRISPDPGFPRSWTSILNSCVPEPSTLAVPKIVAAVCGALHVSAWIRIDFTFSAPAGPWSWYSSSPLRLPTPSDWALPPKSLRSPLAAVI